jgi:DNA-binding MarR family transcriptional regulator
VASRADAPAASGDGLKLERFLPYRLAVAGTLGGRALARIYGEHFGIDIPQWRVMAMLGQCGTLTARDVGALAHMHKTKVSRAVAQLVEQGLVAKTPNRDDRREAFLALSAPGRRIYDHIAIMALDFERRLLGDIPAADLESFERVLAVISERARVLAAGFAAADD